jgi:hypothetical protein
MSGKYRKAENDEAQHEKALQLIELQGVKW